MSYLKMFSHDGLLTVLSHWMTSVGAPSQEPDLRITPVQPGFSGGRVYRVDATREEETTSWALKGWPSSTPRERMAKISQRIVAASQHCDLLAPPLPGIKSSRTSIEALGHHWELARWITGTPLPADASDDEIARGGEAIGRVHLALNTDANREHQSTLIESPSIQETTLISPPISPHVASASSARLPRCLTDRLSRLHQLTAAIASLAGYDHSVDKIATRLATQLTDETLGDPASDFHCRQLAESLVEASIWLRRYWNVFAPGLLERLQRHANDAQPMFAERPLTTWVLRDVHREHILFEPSKRDRPRSVQGVFDYDAVDVDSPAADVARWAGDFSSTVNSALGLSVHQNRVPLEATVAGYRDVCSFSEWEFDVAKTLIEVNSIGSLGNWTTWLIAKNRHFPVSASRIRSRIIHLIASVCRIC
ncbi:phosphotransferase [Rhodopirellula sp. SWK7]|uniref:phosphotransferase n=1 Tax=Rhodopirellula sp. SWK7 TaxID=595460 RepID=UPI0003480826|nr:phosphotransferase [Rhodopirellula sp. SWK7]